MDLIDGYVAGATIAHEYAFALHRELVEAGTDDDHARRLLRESAAVALEMPTLARRLAGLEDEWSEQELLDPMAAERTAQLLEERVAELVPDFATLSDRQRQIIAELVDLVTHAR